MDTPIQAEIMNSAFNTADKASVAGLLISIIIYLIKDRMSLMKDLKNERDARIEELKITNEDHSSLLEKIIISSNKNSRDLKNIVDNHEKNIKIAIDNHTSTVIDKLKTMKNAK